MIGSHFSLHPNMKFKKLSISTGFIGEGFFIMSGVGAGSEGTWGLTSGGGMTSGAAGVSSVTIWEGVGSGVTIFGLIFIPTH